MRVNNILKSLALFLERRQNSLFSYDIDRQKKYIDSFRKPKDNIERSFFQYKCQMRFNVRPLLLLLNIASLPIIFFFLVKYRKKDIDLKTMQTNKKDAVFFRDGKPVNILPNSLVSKYKDIESEPMDGIIISRRDRYFLRQIIFRYPLSWHFILKCVIKVGRYSFVIENYRPEIIIVCAEYSFTSSVLTDYCNKRNIKHVNIMHGEKLYYMRDSFFRFNKCYIWDKYYERLFIKLRAYNKQFIVEVPCSLSFDTSIKIDNISKFDYTYYLGIESEETLVKISKILSKLNYNGYKVSVRPHPRYSNMRDVRRVFHFVNIEDTNTITIENSLLQTKNAISLYSTVLNQAFYNSIPIVIDDVSNSKYFNKLEELGYICLYKKHILLSEVLEGIRR